MKDKNYFTKKDRRKYAAVFFYFSNGGITRDGQGGQIVR